MVRNSFDLKRKKVFTVIKHGGADMKNAFLIFGIISIILSVVIVICSFEQRSGILSAIAAIVAIVGLFVLWQAGAISPETTLLSALLVAVGTIIVPSKFPESLAIQLAIVCYAGMIILILFPAKRSMQPQTPVQS